MGMMTRLQIYSFGCPLLTSPQGLHSAPCSVLTSFTKFCDSPFEPHLLTHLAHLLNSPDRVKTRVTSHEILLGNTEGKCSGRENQTPKLDAGDCCLELVVQGGFLCLFLFCKGSPSWLQGRNAPSASAPSFSLQACSGHFPLCTGHPAHCLSFLHLCPEIWARF